ncbi:family 32 glycoside hydrolase [Melampsora larici-populina 98AG31]|uniref:Family 32 glycoside hydrolase n=1 Tax=Melampsora larici-populina (strain 98AG31 / pathotype 3-4-7) TaxID=747676 RepID=F4R5J8_MELLP|nr:family 32 glycoside hydrolase [Melampsora larici-populina 98AG31]EGG12249.1 family 32 glycoside hydrolase [Melampsora larici-populina 98AG31]
MAIRRLSISSHSQQQQQQHLPQDDFRSTTTTNHTATSSHQIPFLLNRFGYTDESNLSELPSNDPIPSILHIVPPGKNVFSYLQWLSIKSAITKISPQRTMAHMIKGTIPEPGTNFWWDEMLRLPSVEIHETEDRTSIFGNPILDISHKTDVIRLEMLQRFGGIYLDTDILVLNSFDELLKGSEEMVMGIEKADGTLLHPTLVNGLCNAVIVAQRGAKFLDVWYDSYRTFEGQPFRGGGIWNYHSVILPWALAKNATSSQAHITVLDHHSFFMPLWDDPGLKQVHGTLTETDPEPSPFKPNQFAYHMWHHLLDERISIATDDLLLSANQLGPEDALNRKSHFNLIAREYLSDSVLDRFNDWKSKSKLD